MPLLGRPFLGGIGTFWRRLGAPGTWHHTASSWLLVTLSWKIINGSPRFVFCSVN